MNPKTPGPSDDSCGIAQAAAVVGDWWSLLVLREIARGHVRFDALARELGVSRKILSDRLTALTDRGVLARRPYQERPPRHEYVLTEQGRGLLPVLVALQDWADRWLLGDGSLTGLAEEQGAEARRVHALVGTVLPHGIALPATDGPPRDPLAPGRPTVLFAYPATGTPGSAPGQPVVADPIPGNAGCTLENRLFRAAWPRFHTSGIAVHGVSTQNPPAQAAFAHAEGLPFPLLSDARMDLTAALRLPVFRAGQEVRIKRLLLVCDADRTIRHALFPVTDIPAAVETALRTAHALTNTSTPGP
ncbi:winged helix-turn-helix transcriptional regulator [Kitasatospora sp. NPDC087271]|uniref:winged helix-turn-helix transcriptional regulator n=1 Tax=Kitasatospora sp. NPDC087271 TaxID=3364067 RepID=UPI0038028C81